MEEHHTHHAHHTHHTTMDDHDELKNKSNEEKELPFLDQLLENPTVFSLERVLPMADDGAEDILKSSSSSSSMHVHHQHDNSNHKKHSFCSGMMMMDGQDMAQHGVGSMASLGGGMSSGMIMYMDGFRFAMAGNQPCLNLYFPSWTLDTRFKFLLALLVVFGLSFATEAVSKYRHKLSARPIGRDYQARRTRQLLISGLHGFQALLGYVVMLATMTFSLEILLSVVMGLSAGYYYYFAGEIGLEGHVTTNPCCNYMQDESDEHEQRQHQLQALERGQSPRNEDSPTTALLPQDSGDV